MVHSSNYAFAWSLKIIRVNRYTILAFVQRLYHDIYVHQRSALIPCSTTWTKDSVCLSFLISLEFKKCIQGDSPCICWTRRNSVIKVEPKSNSRVKPWPCDHILLKPSGKGPRGSLTFVFLNNLLWTLVTIKSLLPITHTEIYQLAISMCHDASRLPR